MRRISIALLATSSLAAFASAASGADLRAAPAYRAPPPVAPVACANFGGFYIGGHAGAARYGHHWADRDAWLKDEDDDLPGSVTSTKSGFAGGVTGGWNWQARCTVFGIEADYSWANITASSFHTDGDAGGALDTGFVSSKLKGYGTIRARSGVVVDNLLLYVTGGLAAARFDRLWTLTVDGGAASETFSHNNTRWGWTVGVGTEWALWGNWSLKSELLYMGFERDERTFTAVLNGVEAKRFENQDSIWVSRIGLNWRFGGGAPVYAAY